MLKTQKTGRARDYWNARQKKPIIPPPSENNYNFLQLIKHCKTWDMHTLHQYKIHCVYVFVKHVHDKQCFIDFDS